MHAGLKIIYPHSVSTNRPKYILPTILAENIILQKISELS